MHVRRRVVELRPFGDALGGVLDENTIPQLKCAAVAGGANNQLAVPEDAARLMARV